MSIIAPTITTNSPAEYSQRLKDFLEFAERIQIDITDGEFASSRTINLNQVYWPAASQRSTKIDLHLMLKRPFEWLDQIVSLTPDKVILHVESDDARQTLPKIFAFLRKFNIQVGVALLPGTQSAGVAELIKLADSVLIFGGHLGYQGGTADLSQLDKIAAIKAINKRATIEWDGGASLDNVRQIADAGVDQINAGSAISAATDSKAAYKELTSLL